MWRASWHVVVSCLLQKAMLDIFLSNLKIKYDNRDFKKDSKLDGKNISSAYLEKSIFTKFVENAFGLYRILYVGN